MGYLLYLQNLREGALSFLSPICTVLSEGTAVLAPLILAYVYWTVDKSVGIYGVFSLSFSLVLNGIIKLTACVYRPWIRWPQIHPPKSILKTATGYSFPSAHTVMATASFGSLAVGFRKRWLAIIGGIFILCLMFARNWFGCHTLTDVAASFFITAIVVIITKLFTDRIEKNPGKDYLVVIGTAALCVIVVLYILLKPYPLDYDVHGKLLVNPGDMREDTWSAVGMSLAWAIGWFIEKRFINFQMPKSKKERTLTIVTGTVLFAIVYYALDILKSITDMGFIEAVKMAVLILFASAIYPAMIKLYQKRRWKE